MHHKAIYTVNPTTEEAIGYVATFMLQNEAGYNMELLHEFLEIMESEIQQGGSFDIGYFEECIMHLTAWADPKEGYPKNEAAACQDWLSKLEPLNKQNIINTHRNRAECQSESSRHNAAGHHINANHQPSELLSLIDNKAFWHSITGITWEDLCKEARNNAEIIESEGIIEKLFEQLRLVDKANAGELEDEYNSLIATYGHLSYIQGLQDGTKTLHLMLSGGAVGHMMKVEGSLQPNLKATP